MKHEHNIGMGDCRLPAAHYASHKMANLIVSKKSHRFPVSLKSLAKELNIPCGGVGAAQSFH
jgi:hypothetical protein